MKKVLLSSVVLLSFAASTAVQVASAAEVAKYGSKAGIEFKVDEEGTTDPEDPNKPGEPVTPTPDPWFPEGPEEGTKGPLTIDFASSFNFGEQVITSSDKKYNTSIQEYVKQIHNEEDGSWSPVENPTEEDITEGPNYVQVTDNRGTEAGWVLKVKQTNQFTTVAKEGETIEGNAAGKKLSGAQMIFSNGAVKTISESTAPSTVASFTLAVDNPEGSAESIVMSAEAGQGAGTFLNTFGTWSAPEEAPTEFSGNAKESVRLSVPGKSTKYAARYVADLAWTLSDIVANG